MQMGNNLIRNLNRWEADQLASLQTWQKRGQCSGRGTEPGSLGDVISTSFPVSPPLPTSRFVRREEEKTLGRG